MSNLTDILGSLVQAGLSPSGNQRMKNTIGAGGNMSSGGLSDILGGLMGASGNSAAKQSGSSLDGLGDLLGGALGQMGRSLASGDKVAIGGLGALMGSLFGGGSSSAKGAVGGGVMAVLASLAYSALQNSGTTPSQVSASLLENPNSTQKAEVDHEAALIIRAMLNSAKADGHIDKTEMQRIIGKLQEDGLNENERQQLQEEMQKPFDLTGLVTAVGNNPQLAAQIYIASLLAIEVDTNAERQYMQQLANGLGLSDQTVSHIKMAMGIA